MCTVMCIATGWRRRQRCQLSCGRVLALGSVVYIFVSVETTATCDMWRSTLPGCVWPSCSCVCSLPCIGCAAGSPSDCSVCFIARTPSCCLTSCVEHGVITTATFFYLVSAVRRRRHFVLDALRVFASHEAEPKHRQILSHVLRACAFGEM